MHKHKKYSLSPPIKTGAILILKNKYLFIFIPHNIPYISRIQQWMARMDSWVDWTTVLFTSAVEQHQRLRLNSTTIAAFLCSTHFIFLNK